MKRNHRLTWEAVLLGLVGGLSAQLFVFLLGVSEHFFMGWLAAYTPPGLPEEGGVLKQVIGSHGLWLIPVATTLGGLISGILVYSTAPEAEGHGTDNAVKAYHRAGGFIRARIPFIKMIASAITIGSGGAAGREGPTALISAGFSSIYSDFMHRTEEERRILLLAGMAAGLSAIFRSPIGCAVFAVEVLYRDMEYESSALIYTMLASVVAYVVNGLFVGWKPLFQIPPNLTVIHYQDYGRYLVLGVVSGVAASMIPAVFYGIRDAFHALPIPPHFKPAIGGLGVGIMALFLPQVLGGGYGWMQEVIDGRLTGYFLFVLVGAKLLAFSLTVSSGGSGGIFAPCLFLGAMVGGGVAHLFGQPAASFAVIGLASVFGAAARVPFATMLMVAEMTGGFQLLPAAALAVTVSYVCQEALTARLKYKSLYEAQVPSRIYSPAHQAEYVSVALQMLNRCEVPMSPSADHLSLVSLLQSGVPIDLPDGRHLSIMEVTPESLCAGQPPDGTCLPEPLSDMEITTVIRKNEVLLPIAAGRLQLGDILLVMKVEP